MLTPVTENEANVPSEAFDPKSIAPYSRIGVRLMEDFLGPFKISVTTDAGSTFVVRIQWKDAGFLQDLKRWYSGKLEDDDVVLALQTTYFRGHMSENSNAFDALREVAGGYATRMHEVETTANIPQVFQELKPVMVEYLAKSMLDDWRQAELTSACLANDAAARRRHVAVSSNVIEFMSRNGHPHLRDKTSEHAILIAGADAEDALAAEYREEAESAREAAIQAARTLKRLVPSAELPIPDELVEEEGAGFRL